jgi:hypothetical protein
MPMNERERRFIEYRPQLGIVVDLKAIIESKRAEMVDGGEVASNLPDNLPDLPEEVKALLELPIPEEVKEALEHPATPVLDKALQTRDKVDNLLKDLEDMLKDDVANGVSFQDYLNNRGEDGDADIKRAWEDFHGKDINGKLAGDVYPVVANVRDQLDKHINLLNDMVLEGDIHHDSLEDLYKAEANRLDQIVRNDNLMNDENVRAELKTKTEIVQAVEGAIDSISSFADDVTELVNLNVDDLFRNQVETVVEEFAEASSTNLESLGKFSELGFAQYAEETEEIKERMENVSDANEILHEELRQLRPMILEAHRVLTWLEEVDTNYDESPFTEVIENLLVPIECLIDTYEEVLLDMHKTNEMQTMQFEDFVGHLRWKESHRQTRHMTRDVQKHFDRNDPNRQKQVQRFTQNMGYKKRRAR